MDEITGKNKMIGSGEAIVVLVFLFCLAVFLLYKFGAKSSQVVNEDVNNNPNLQTREEIFENLKSQSNSEIYNKYLDKIFKDGNNLDGNNIAENYKKELESKVQLPTYNLFFKGKGLGNSYNERANYLNEFESLFIEFKARGGFSESKILEAQISGQQILPLSDYDKETLVKLANEYEIWSDKILSLNVPQIYERKSLEAAENALNIAFVLKKIVVENDMQIYPLWILKYSEIMFDIMANRYAK